MVFLPLKTMVGPKVRDREPLLMGAKERLV